MSIQGVILGAALAGLVLLTAACAPSPTANVIIYEIERRMGAFPPAPPEDAPGEITGSVVDPDGHPVEGVVAIVALRTGTPYTGTTNADGVYVISGVSPGPYVPAFIAPGYRETALETPVGLPNLLTVHSSETTHAPQVILHPHVPTPLPTPLPQAVELRQTDAYQAGATYPPDAEARVYAYSFTHQGVEIDNLRLYLPIDPLATDAVDDDLMESGDPDDNDGNDHGGQLLPLLFMIYPSHTDAWEEVSVAYAAEGFAFVAVSPVGAHHLDAEAHAQDARVAFELAMGGHLHPKIDSSRVIALGGSFSSAILHHFLRDEADRVQAWVTVGGVSNAFTGAAEFYRGELQMPPEFELAIPAMGPANIYPLAFLSFSPVYTAGRLPSTFIVHTAADRIFTIDQAYQIERALRAAGVPVETHYYDDDSHYLMIGDYITEASIEVYYRILDYIHAQFEP